MNNTVNGGPKSNGLNYCPCCGTDLIAIATALAFNELRTTRARAAGSDAKKPEHSPAVTAAGKVRTRNVITPARRATVLRLLGQNLSAAEVARQSHLSETSVKRIQKAGTATPAPV